ncbi:MAG: sensor histidine kinase [Chloroflexota bacterium]|nr:HAMP domain-containing histidine kinase [Chloroflexota bacterium]MBI5702531.1 HAMP domain-containing histidine kinase [Chloroflexota bacterium]
MFTSLRSRLWLSYAFVIAVALGVVAFVLLVYLIRNPLLTRLTQQRLTTVQDLILTSPQKFLNSPSRLTEIAQTNNVRVIVFDASRSLALDTSPEKPSLPFPRRNLLNRAAQTVRDSEGAAWLYLFSRLPNGEVLVVAAPRPRVPALAIFTDEFFAPILQAAGMALALALLLAFALSRWVADPLQSVVGAAQKYPLKEIQPVPLRGPREVQDLTRAFNAMVARVHAAQQSQKNFVANVSHELKTPLTSIQGFAQAILDDTAATPAARKQAAQIIYDEARRLHRMALDLLDLARLEAGAADLKISPLETSLLLHGIVERFTPRAQAAGIALRLDVPPHLPPLLGDGDRLAQVFTNLLDNALKFTPPGGEILISAKKAEAEIELSVADTGSGVPKEALPHLFERFYQADPSRAGGAQRGAGLGLAIVKEIIEAHGGTIGVRSQEGHGTTFTIRLPLAK